MRDHAVEIGSDRNRYTRLIRPCHLERRVNYEEND